MLEVFYPWGSGVKSTLAHMCWTAVNASTSVTHVWSGDVDPNLHGIQCFNLVRLGVNVSTPHMLHQTRTMHRCSSMWAVKTWPHLPWGLNPARRLKTWPHLPWGLNLARKVEDLTPPTLRIEPCTQVEDLTPPTSRIEPCTEGWRLNPTYLKDWTLHGIYKQSTGL